MQQCLSTPSGCHDNPHAHTNMVGESSVILNPEPYKATGQF